MDVIATLAKGGTGTSKAKGTTSSCFDASNNAQEERVAPPDPQEKQGLQHCSCTLSTRRDGL
jgi:hypothetical protein